MYGKTPSDKKGRRFAVSIRTTYAIVIEIAVITGSLCYTEFF